MDLSSKIESILFFKNEPIVLSELSKMLDTPKEKLQITINKLQEEFKDRGIVLITNDDEVSLGTHPDASELIEKLQKEEFSRELGRAGLETLAIVLYRGPVARREIDNIRGVNSGFTLRTLLVRGLVERTESNGRSHMYKPTLKLLQHLGISKKEELPEFETAFKKVEEFVKSNPEESNG